MVRKILLAVLIILIHTDHVCAQVFTFEVKARPECYWNNTEIRIKPGDKVIVK